ncbi:MAG: GlxA family transcriptional regulator [Acidimicrobiales bacterium]
MVVVAFDGVQVLDVTGPAEVFASAERLGGEPGVRYSIEIVAPTAEAITCSGGVTLVPDGPLADVTAPLDTLVVAGGPGVFRAAEDREIVAHVDRLAASARRVTSVCTGAFLLAATGRLDGRRATTHWAATAALAQRYPQVIVEPDPIFVRDGMTWTSAGVTAGIDLALELVGHDHGRETAAEVARWLVMFLQRPGGQAQFSVPLAAGGLEVDVLIDLQGWMIDHLDRDLSVTALAARCHLSPRTLHRLVRREVGMTPGAWVEQIRVEAARRALEATGLSISAIAERCGFRTVSTLYRAFDRRLGTAPASYRNHFRTSPPPLRRSAS